MLWSLTSTLSALFPLSSLSTLFPLPHSSPKVWICLSLQTPQAITWWHHKQWCNPLISLQQGLTLPVVLSQSSLTRGDATRDFVLDYGAPLHWQDPLGACYIAFVMDQNVGIRLMAFAIENTPIMACFNDGAPQLLLHHHE